MKKAVLLAGIAAIGLLSLSGVSSAKKVTISYTSWWQDPAIESSIIKKFMEENPDINVKFSLTKGVYIEKLLVSAAAGSAPDVFRVDASNMATFVGAKMAEPLNAYIKRDNLNKNLWYEGYYNYFNYDGKQLALPLSAGGGGLFYREQLFAKAGLPNLVDIAEGKDWSFESFAQIAKKLTLDLNGDGRIDQWGIGDVPDWELEHYIQYEGGSFWSADGKKCLVNSKEAIAGLTTMHNLMHVQKVWNLSAGWDAIWVKGNAMQHSGHWAIDNLHKNKVTDWNVVVTFPNKKNTPPRASGDGIVVSSNCKNKEAAWKLARYFATQGGQTIFAKNGSCVPSYRPIVNDWLKTFYPDKNIKATVKNALDAIAEPHVVRKNQKRMDDALAPIKAAFYAGKKSPAQTADEMFQTVNKFLK